MNNITLIAAALGGEVLPDRDYDWSQMMAVRIAEMGLPNTPNTAAQGSPRMAPGPHPMFVFCDTQGVLAEQAIGLFLHQEDAWRNLSKWPSPVAASSANVIAAKKDGSFVDTGVPIVNSTGKPVPVTVADDQHFTVDVPLIATASHGQHFAMGANQVVTLTDWACRWARDDLLRCENQRAIGWVDEAMAKVALVSAAMGHHNIFPVFVMKAVTKRISQLISIRGTEPPYMTLNTAGMHQADHFHCRVSTWMTSRITMGRARWLTYLLAHPKWTDFLPWSTLATVRAQYLHGLECLAWVMRDAEKNGAPLGGMWDDYDIRAGDVGVLEGLPGFGLTKPLRAVQAPGWAPKWYGVMSAWAIPAMVSSRELAPKYWDFFLPRLEEMYARNTRFHLPAKASGKMPDLHSISLAISLASATGRWRLFGA